MCRVSESLAPPLQSWGTTTSGGGRSPLVAHLCPTSPVTSTLEQLLVTFFFVHHFQKADEMALASFI